MTLCWVHALSHNENARAVTPTRVINTYCGLKTVLHHYISLEIHIFSFPHDDLTFTLLCGVLDSSRVIKAKTTCNIVLYVDIMEKSQRQLKILRNLKKRRKYVCQIEVSRFRI